MYLRVPLLSEPVSPACICVCVCVRAAVPCVWMNIFIFLGTFTVHIMRCGIAAIGVARIEAHTAHGFSIFIIYYTQRTRLSYIYFVFFFVYRFEYDSKSHSQRPNVCCVILFFVLFLIFDFRANLYLSNTIERWSGQKSVWFFLFSLSLSLFAVVVDIFRFSLCLFRQLGLGRAYYSCRMGWDTILICVMCRHVWFRRARRWSADEWLFVISPVPVSYMNQNHVTPLTQSQLEPLHTAVYIRPTQYVYIVAWRTQAQLHGLAFCCGCNAFWCCLYSIYWLHQTTHSQTLVHNLKNLFSLETRD